MNSVYLFKEAKSLFNALYSLQPFQGRLANVKSFHIKDHLRCCRILCEGDTMARKKKEHQEKEHHRVNHYVLHVIHSCHLASFSLYSVSAPLKARRRDQTASAI